jgi:hypothetical protein
MTKDLPWLIGLGVAIIFFAIFEARALWHPDRQNTLSRFVYNAVHNRPVTTYMMGMFTALLMVHLLAHFCPSEGAMTAGLFLWWGVG